MNHQCAQFPSYPKKEHDKSVRWLARYIKFKSVVQAVLLFGAETWVVTPRMGKALGGFRPRWREV